MSDPYFEYEARQEIWRKICKERSRQDRKFPRPNTGLFGDDQHKKLAILMEEVGEVANAILEHYHENQLVEIVQVAAVCVAWLESEMEQERANA